MTTVELPRTIIYIPADLKEDVSCANNCIAHVNRHGHTLFALLRDWDTVLRELHDGKASRVVMDRPEHVAGYLPVPIEFVGETTRRIGAATDEAAPTAPKGMSKLLWSLFVTTIGAALMWIGLAHVELAVEWPLYAVIFLVLALWVPAVGIGLAKLWGGDIALAYAHGFVAGGREAYSDGFVDALMMNER